MSSDKPGKICAAGSLALLALAMLVMAVYPVSADLPAPPGVPTFTPTESGQPVDSPHVDNAAVTETPAQSSGSGIDGALIMIAVLALVVILAAAALFIVFRK